MQHLELWRFLVNKISAGHQAVILLVGRSEGSSPGRAGFKMAVCDTGEMEGSIGGGSMECRWAEMALQGPERPSWQWQVHQKNNPNASGLICSGRQLNISCPLGPSDLPTLKAIISCIETLGEGFLHIDAKGLRFEPGPLPYSFEMDENAWHYREKVGHKQTISIIGGGHVGLALSQIFRLLGFRVWVYDNRPKTLEENDFAHVKIAAPYTALAQHLPECPQHYVVVMTFSMPDDVEALEAVVFKKFDYLGLMGSQAKIAAIKKQLREKGVPETLIARIEAPVGLPIHSQTPYEIAVSVAARIIQLKNQPI